MTIMRLAALCAAVLAVPAQAATVIDPIHLWTFNDGTTKDSIGNLDGTLHGNAQVKDGQLVLDGSKLNGGSHMSTGKMGSSFAPHTLVAWLTLDTLSQAGGAAISIIDNPGTGANEKFDAIVFGERVSKQWLAGSDFFRRTPVNNGGALETSVGEHMIAISYAASGISIYRNGVFYASGGTYAPLAFSDPAVLLGLRHSSAANGNGLLKGSINQAAIYNSALTAADIGTLYAQGAVVGVPGAGAGAVPEPATWAMMILGMGLVGGVMRRRPRTKVSFA